MDIAAILIALSIIFGAGVLMALFEAFILIQVWGWFIVPFFGLPQLNYPLAIGICVVSSILCPMPIMPKEPKYDGFRSVGIIVIRLLILWGTAFVAHLFL